MNGEELNSWFEANKNRYVQTDGRLLVAEYLGRNTPMPKMRIDEELRQWGFSLEMVKFSHLERDPFAQTRVAVIRKEWEKDGKET